VFFSFFPSTMICASSFSLSIFGSPMLISLPVSPRGSFPDPAPFVSVLVTFSRVILSSPRFEGFSHACFVLLGGFFLVLCLSYPAPPWLVQFQGDHQDFTSVFHQIRVLTPSFDPRFTLSFVVLLVFSSFSLTLGFVASLY